MNRDEELKRLADTYDPFSAEVRVDPAKYHAALRAHSPLHRYSNFEHPLYTMSRHADVSAMLENHELWSSKYGQMPSYAEEGGIRSDPPEHTIYRRLVSPMFGPKRMMAMQSRFHAVSNQLIDAFIGRGQGDLSAEFAQIYPITVAADLLGVDAERHEDFRRWSNDFIKGANSSDTALEQSARDNIYNYLGGLLQQRREALQSGNTDLPQDAITVFAQGVHPEGRPFTDEEIFPVALLLLVGGTDTTTLLLGSCIYRLLQRRELWEQLCAQPELTEVAIEESLRFDAPVMGTYRTHTTPVTLHGVTMPAGSKCENLFASANRDDEVWDDPDTFRLDRDINLLRQQHLGFGRGIHRCVGAPLARLDATIALRTIVERLPRLRLNGTPKWFQPFTLQGVVSLPVRWD